MAKVKTDIENWEDAEVAAQEYVELNSRLELLAEQFKEFAERRHDQVGRERRVGELLIGFKPIPAQVRVPSDALAWLQGQGDGRYVETKTVPKKSLLKTLLAKANDVLVATYRQRGIVYAAGYEQFFLRLARHEPVESDE